jgi:GNAT superfamily N-acetyltransferase
MLATVTTTYLEMTSPAELRPKRFSRGDLLLARVDPPMPELNRFFYTAVGGDWYWIDRLPWTYQQWQDYLTAPGVQTWVLSVGGVPAGYAELAGDAGGDVELAYFGLLPRFVGQGLGGHLLTEAVERAWAYPARRVWLHTCTLDHPNALAHYRARGFRSYKQETKKERLPDRTPGPWPGAVGEPRTQQEGERGGIP